MSPRLTHTRHTLLRVLADHPYATTNQLYELMRSRIKRFASEDSHRRNIRAILRNATLAGLVKRRCPAPKASPDDPLFLGSKPILPYCYYLAGRGKAVLDLPGRKHVEKSPYSLSHEAEITAYHIALESVLGDRLKWRQVNLRKTMNPDALFAVKAGEKAHWFFVEIEKSRQGNQRNGKSGLQRKCDRYDAFRGSAQCRKDYQYFSDFRLIIVFTTDERQTNFLTRLAETLPFRWIWTTNETEYRTDAGGKIYLTPKDFRTSRYSLLDLVV